LNYDNGRSRTLFQIPLVQFNSPNNLQRIDGGAYSRTLESGTPRRSTAGSNGAGRLVSNTLEGSNVDIADEFTKMIQAQRVYSANARTITTTNSMLEEVINIVR
jgi:flagellar hook protein FlgE